MCFGMDMPELHFHHHTIRLLKNILKERSANNQFLIVTHSPIFIEPEKLDNVLVVKEKGGKTVVKQLGGSLESSERQRLSRHLDEDTREFFFSRAVLIVEGPTEKGAMPIFSKSRNQDFDKYGISVIEAGGQFCEIFIRILIAFDFPYLVLHDYDALMDVCQSIEIKGKSIKTSAIFYNLRQLLKKEDLKIIGKMESRIQTLDARRRKETYHDDCFKELRDVALKYDVYVLPSDFEGILERDGYQGFLKEGRKLAGRKKSKVICGRYVAEKIIEKKLKIPKEFCDVIDSIVKKSIVH
jgi:predicted ATP-dependent endonuclease of OLD family